MPPIYQLRQLRQKSPYAHARARAQGKQAGEGVAAVATVIEHHPADSPFPPWPRWPVPVTSPNGAPLSRPLPVAPAQTSIRGRWVQSGSGGAVGLANGHDAAVLATVAALEAPAGRLSMRLTTVSRAFLTSPRFERAVAGGWAMVELFGVDPSAPADRQDAWGLVVHLALTPQHGGPLVELDEGGPAAPTCGNLLSSLPRAGRTLTDGNRSSGGIADVVRGCGPALDEH